MELVRKAKNIIETNQLFSWMFDKTANTPFYRIIIYRKINKYIQNIKETENFNIVLETTNLCNAKCVMCPYTIMKRKKEIMSDETFKIIVDRMKKEHIAPQVFILNGIGEPLIDKSIFERIKILKKEFPNSINKFYTNFRLADNAIIDEILECGLDEINISFNGYDKTSYEKTMKIDYDTTLKNLNNLIDEKNKRKADLKVRISMALVNYNDDYVKEFIQKWEKKVDSVSVNKIHTYNNSVKDISGQYRINYNKKPYPCKYIWNTIVFGVRGDIFLCCLDYEGRYNFGNVKDNEILTSFYAKEFEDIRSMHLNNNLTKIKMCLNCYTPYRNGVEWFVDELY